MKRAALVAALALTGCAASVGSVKWAIGDARVESCGPNAAPECRDLVKGGTFSSIVGAIFGNAIETAGRFFGAGSPPPQIVIQNGKPAGESSGPPSRQ